MLACLVPTPSIDSTLAARYFQEARWISADDDGSLWGRSLYGPMIFVDPATRDAVASEATPDGYAAQGSVFVGRLGKEYNIANTAFQWKGRRWTMVMWPLPSGRADRATLMMHECYHRLQSDLGWPGGSPPNAHLESLEGRLWLEMELRALARALAATDPRERREAVADALAFRHARYVAFPKAKAEEDPLELNEGLAEFTGYELRGGSEAESRLWLGSRLAQSVGLDTYARSFPYLTGTAYAMLLNAFEGVRWRKALGPNSSLSAMLQASFKVPSLTTSVTRTQEGRYGYDALKAAETKRAVVHAQRIAEIRRRLIDGPVLRIDFVNMRITLDPNNVMPLGAEGTYYPTATIVDAWGTLTVTGGALVGNDWRSVRVSAPGLGAMSGEGWKLTLNAGWRIVPGQRPGDSMLAKSG